MKKLLYVLALLISGCVSRAAAFNRCQNLCVDNCTEYLKSIDGACSVMTFKNQDGYYKCYCSDGSKYPIFTEE